MMEPQGYFASFGYQLLDFSKAVLHQKPLEAGPESALMDFHTIQAMYNSAKYLRWEQVLPTQKKALETQSILSSAIRSKDRDKTPEQAEQKAAFVALSKL